MQLFLGAVPIILRLYSPKLEDTYYSQIIPGIICQSLLTDHFNGGHGCLSCEAFQYCAGLNSNSIRIWNMIIIKIIAGCQLLIQKSKECYGAM